MQRKSYCGRMLSNAVFVAASYAALLLGLFLLLCFFYVLLERGWAHLDLSLLTHVTASPMEAGGLANAIVGSLMMTGLALLISIPVGVIAAIYIVEYGKKTILTKVIRYANDMLLTMPSIVIGLFIFAIIVIPSHRFSALAGAIALALIAIPIIMRTTEDVLYLVSPNLREAGLALGIRHYKVLIFVILKTARSGVMTGIMLAFARIFGETAPLLFTALNDDYMSFNLLQPVASLPVTIYNYALSPYQNWQDIAWSGALLMTVFVVGCNVFAKYYASKNKRQAEEHHGTADY